jgi:hypothetical protein
MPFTLTPVTTSRHERVELAEINPDVKLAVDEAYEFGKTDPSRLEIDFVDEGQADAFLSEARDYAYQVEPRLVVAGNSTKKGIARFRVTAYVLPTPVGDAAE